MAHYLLTKSFTERSYFDTFISEYNNKRKVLDESQDERLWQRSKETIFR